MYIPNSFTPDLDGKNDNFCISYHGLREETFTFNLYSRFSELVYSTNNIQDLSFFDIKESILLFFYKKKIMLSYRILETL